MSNKKVKKNKGTTLSLQAFNAQIQDGNAPSAGQNVVYASKKPTYSNWADEMEDEDMVTDKERIILPAGPRSSRGPNVDDSQIPRSPPFTVHLSNVAYEIGDDDIYNFFRDMKINSVRIPRDPGNKPKGYAYVDFENREDLIAALTMTEQQLKGRAVRISLGEGQNRRDGGTGRGPGGGSYSDATPSDWRSDMRPNSPPRRDGGGGGGGFNDFRRGNDFNRGGDFERGGGGGGRDRDRGFGGGPDMTRDQMTGGRPRGGFNDFPERGDRDHFQRDRSGSNEMGSNWRNERPAPEREPDFSRNSYGGGGPRPGPDYSSMRTRDDPPRGQDSRGQYDRGYQRNASPPRGGGGYQEDRGRRGYDAPNRASRENSPPSYRNTAPPPENEADRSDSEHGSVKQSNEPSRERKKLVLAPRTVTAQVAEPAPQTSSAIFGGAKPVDTAAREKEIEEKLLSMDIRTTRVRSDSHVSDEPRIRILQRTPEERDKRDRDIKFEKERKQRERYPSTSSEKSRDLQYRHSIPQDLPKSLQQQRTRSPTSTTTVSSVASSFCSENFHPSNNPPTSKHFQRSEEEDDFEHDESTKPKPVEVRNEMVHNENNEPLKNPWNRRKDIRDEEVPRRQVYESDRKTPDFDRNSEKEKDTNSDPEDDRDSHHRFINEDNVRNKEVNDDDDDDFCKVSRSRPRRDRDRDGDKGIKDDGSRGDRRGGYGGRGGGNYGGSSGGGGYSGPRPVDLSRRGDRGDFGPRRQPYGRAGGDVGRDRDGGGRSAPRGGGGYSTGPTNRDR